MTFTISLPNVRLLLSILQRTSITSALIRLVIIPEDRDRAILSNLMSINNIVHSALASIAFSSMRGNGNDIAANIEVETRTLRNG